jgi:serine/threonine protein kinase
VVFRIDELVILHSFGICKHPNSGFFIRRVVHLDIKPANIYLDENLNVKLGDFGLVAVTLNAYTEQLRYVSRCEGEQLGGNIHAITVRWSPPCNNILSLQQKFDRLARLCGARSVPSSNYWAALHGAPGRDVVAGRNVACGAHVPAAVRDRALPGTS